MNVMTAARSPLAPDAPPRPGLRERKKIKTREAIRGATYALVAEQGYDSTTIEQIAERAEVSPSTVFRYFPTKEDIVITDEYDEPLLAELAARPADEPWTDSVRYVIRRAVHLAVTEQPEITTLRARLMLEVPAVARGCGRPSRASGGRSPTPSPAAPGSTRTDWRCGCTSCP